MTAKEKVTKLYKCPECKKKGIKLTIKLLDNHVAISGNNCKYCRYILTSYDWDKLVKM